MMHKDTVEGTQIGYCSSIRHWVRFNIEIDEDPFEFPIDPYKALFWIQTRFEEAGSIKSLKTWRAILSWICKIAGVHPEFKEHPDYVRYIKSINKQHNEGVDSRLPFKMIHMTTYIKWLFEEYEKKPSLLIITKATLASMYFLTMSRPSELVESSSSYDRLRGLRIKHFKLFYDDEHNIPMIRLQIETFKNQHSRKISKYIYLAPTKCNFSKSCICRFMDPYKFFLNMIKYRDNMVVNLEAKLLKPHSTSNDHYAIKSKLQKLRLKDDNYIFINDAGNPINTNFLRSIVREIIAVNNIMITKNYTAYSWRIGGTTRASQASLDHCIILKYVGWSTSSLQDVSMRYIRYSPEELAIVSYKMVHPSQPLKNLNKIYDPWGEKLNLRFRKN